MTEKAKNSLVAHLQDSVLYEALIDKIVEIRAEQEMVLGRATRTPLLDKVGDLVRADGACVALDKLRGQIDALRKESVKD